jgi:hypothetical protein
MLYLALGILAVPVLLIAFRLIVLLLYVIAGWLLSE